MWFGLLSGRKRPEAGLHFGSLLLGQPTGLNGHRTILVVPRSRPLRIVMHSWVCTSWTFGQIIKTSDRLFSSEGRTTTRRRFFSLTTATCLGVLIGTFKNGPARLSMSKVPSTLIFGMTRSSLPGFPTFRTVLPDVLSWVIPRVPLQWYKGNLRDLSEGLIRRLSNLTELVELDGTKFRQFVHQNSENDTLRLSDPGIHKLRTADRRSPAYRGLATSYAKFIHSDGLCFAKLEE